MPDLSPPSTIVSQVVAAALAEDLVPLGDITSSLLPPESRGVGRFVSAAEGVVSGVECAFEAFRQVDSSLSVSWQVFDGTEVGVGDLIGRVEGSMASILSAERTALNFLCHLSGISSLTRRYVRAGQNKTRIRDSRFTTPGLRTLEKSAVRAGGGINHRGSLSDGILLRDKHLINVSAADAIRRARLLWPGRTVQVECSTVDQAAELLDSNPDMLMLVHATPELAEQVVGLVGGKIPVEVFGAIDIADVDAFVSSGVDLISVTTITQSAPAFEIGFEIEAK